MQKFHISFCLVLFKNKQNVTFVWLVGWLFVLIPCVLWKKKVLLTNTNILSIIPTHIFVVIVNCIPIHVAFGKQKQQQRLLHNSCLCKYDRVHTVLESPRVLEIPWALKIHKHAWKPMRVLKSLKRPWKPLIFWKLFHSLENQQQLGTLLESLCKWRLWSSKQLLDLIHTCHWWHASAT